MLQIDGIGSLRNELFREQSEGYGWYNIPWYGQKLAAIALLRALPASSALVMSHQAQKWATPSRLRSPSKLAPADCTPHPPAHQYPAHQHQICLKRYGSACLDPTEIFGLAIFPVTSQLNKMEGHLLWLVDVLYEVLFQP